MKYLFPMGAAALLLLCGSCSTTTYTRAGNYPKMYEQQPATIVVMPPINKTTSVEAKEYFYYTVNTALCEAGYYVVSPFLAMEIFKAESAYDSELFIDRDDLSIFGRVFNADALLFTVVNAWDKSKLAGKITVNVDYILKSVKTNEVIFKRNGNLTLDTSVNTSGGGIFGTLISMAATALSTTETGKVRAARNCNYYIFKDIPRGRYDADFGQDRLTAADGADITAVVR